MEKVDFLTEKLDPLTDGERLAALDASGLLDSTAEEAFDRLTRLASRLLNAPVALVSLVTSDRQFFKSVVAHSAPWDTCRETPLNRSFCKYVVQTGSPLIVEDSLTHPLVSTNLATLDGSVVAYCGMPLITSTGHVLGSFCVLDTHARRWTSEEVETVSDLAASVMTEIELRARAREAEKRTAELEEAHRENVLLQQKQQEAESAQARLIAILEETSDYICMADIEGNITYANMAQRSLYADQQHVGKRHITDYHPDWASRLLLEEGIPTALEKGIWSGETAIMLPDGRYIPLSKVMIGHHSSTGEEYISLISRDISDRKIMEKALQESEERYHKAIAGAEGAVYEYDFDNYRYTYIDPQIERITGYSVAEVTPALWKRIALQMRLRGTLEGKDIAEADRCFREGELEYWTADCQYRTPSGELRWVSDAAFTRRDETGRVIGSLGILQDITDRVRTEEELRESEERFRALADSAPVLIWMADATGKTTYFNRQWLRYTGRALEQELGYGWAEGMHSEDLAPCRQVVQAAWDTRSEYRMEYRLCRADGTHGWVLETGSPRFAQDGAFLGYIGSCIDVQEQKQALEAVQLSEARLNAAQRMSRIGNWEFNPVTSEIRWSDETFRIYGMPPGSPAPTVEQHQTQVHPDDRERWIQTILAAKQTGQPYELEFCAFLPDGTPRTLHARGELRTDDAGQLVALWGTVQDISERKEAEQERTRLLEILEATPDYVAVTDMQGRLLYLNRTGRDILALTEEEVKAHDIRDRYTPSAASLILNVGMPMAQRDGIWMGETIIHAADGRKIPMLQMIQVHRNADGEPHYFSTIARDITERKRSEEESLRNLRDAAVREAMAKRNQELQALSRRLVEVQEAERTHIARELHDEIGQNLTGLKLTLGAIPRLGEEGKERNLKLAMELTTELMGQVRAMSLDLRPGMLDDLGLLPALQWHLDRYTTQTGVCVEFEEEGLRDRRFNRASETAAYRIVQEALTNVARYADTKAARVRVRVVRDKLHLSIVDQGKGFEPEVILAAGRSNGLAGMRERALLLGGTFGIQSSPGAGTRLMAELPL
ncbi:MAG: multi-sensor signal transduction histidine kinase [Chthonomonadaceae bacterium]|nr:multi-sensor signal transduction histidine kinase [Chthonomonadaceae bacterium]